jgi:hypothetical protein
MVVLDQSAYDSTDVFVTLEDLSNDVYDHHHHEDGVLLLETLYVKRATKDSSETTSYSRGGATKLNYDKMVVCMDVLGGEGSNIVVFLLGQGRNAEFFSRMVDKRDDGSFGEWLLSEACYYLIICQSELMNCLIPAIYQALASCSLLIVCPKLLSAWERSSTVLGQ